MEQESFVQGKDSIPRSGGLAAPIARRLKHHLFLFALVTHPDSDLQRQLDALRSEMEVLRGTIPTKGEGPIQVKGNVISIQDNRLDGSASFDGNGGINTPVTMIIIENGVPFFYSVQAVFEGAV